MPHRLTNVAKLLLVAYLFSSACAASVLGREQAEFNIVKYGAVTGGKAFCTEAIQHAIDACHAAGGGEVVVPDGSFLTATLYLKDHVALHLMKGATLLGSTKIADYPLLPPTSTRIDDFLRRALIFARGAKDLSIAGEGVIDGNNRMGQTDFFDDSQRKRKDRPLIVWFDQCENIRIQDVTFKAAGFWTQAYSRSKGGRISGIKVRENTNDNNDGCDLVDSHDFVVENCDIDCLDDGICLKAYTAFGCKNITLRNNKVRSLCNAIKTGTDSSGDGFQNLLIENNELYQVGRAALALETTDGGILKNIVVKNIKMDVVGTPIFIKLGDRQRPMTEANGEKVVPLRIGIVEDIHISGIHATVGAVAKPKKDVYSHDETRLYKETGPAPSSITGIPDHDVKGITIEDVEIEILGGYKKPVTVKYVDNAVPEKSTAYPNPDMFGMLPGYGFYLRHARDVTMRNIHVTSKIEDPRAAVYLDDVHDSKFIGVTGKNVSETPTFLVKPSCVNVVTNENRGSVNPPN